MASGPFGNTLKIEAEDFLLDNGGIVTPEKLQFYEKDLNTIFLVVNGKQVVFRRTDF